MFEVAAEQDRDNGTRFTPREPAYLTAAMTGLRRSELAQLTWSDVDLDTETLRIRVDVGKAKREDVISLHRQVVEALRAMKPTDAKAMSRIFETMPTILTFYRDLERARRKWISQAADEAERLCREESDFLAKYDTEGLVFRRRSSTNWYTRRPGGRWPPSGDPGKVVPWVDTGRMPHRGDPMTSGDLHRILEASEAAGLQRFLFHNHDHLTAAEWRVVSRRCGIEWDEDEDGYWPPNTPKPSRH